MFKSPTPIALFGTLAALALTPTAGADLLAHYKFDGDATDSSAGGNDLTALNNTVSADPTISGAGGADGGFASFDGGNLFNTTFVPVTGDADRTLSLWVRTTNDNSGSAGATTAFAAGWGGTNSDPRNRYDLGLEKQTNDQLRNEFNAGASTSSTGTDINDGVWNHLVVTWTGSTNTASFFLNGLAYGTEVEADDLATDSTVGITIGGDARAGSTLLGIPVTPQRFWIGDIDDVQVYNTALDLTDVQTLFNNPGSAIPEPGSLALLGLGGLFVLRRRRGE